MEQLVAFNGKQKVVVLGVAKPFLIAALHEEFSLPLIIVTAQPEDAKGLYEQLKIWCSPSVNLMHFPEVDFSPYEYFTSYPRKAMMERLQVLASLSLYGAFASRHSERREESYVADGKLYEKSGCPSLSFPSGLGVTAKQHPLTVASALAIVSKTIPVEDFARARHFLRRGMTADPVALLRKWQSVGYEMEDVVEIPGTMSRRGGIIDIFPVCSQFPARIEFLGNQIESMRLFNPESQCSIEPISLLNITPAKELLMSPGRQMINALDLDSCTAEVKTHFEEDIARLQQGQWFSGAEFYSPLFNTADVFDYLCSNALIILDSAEQIEVVIERINREAQELREAKLGNAVLPRGFPSPYFTWEELESKVKARQWLDLESWNTALVPGSDELPDENHRQTLPFSLAASYAGDLGRFLREAKQMIQQKQRVVVVSNQTSRLAELFQGEEVYVSPTSKMEEVPPCGSITLLQGSLGEGWVMNHELNLITDAELFGFVKQRRLSKKEPIRRQWLLPQLNPGDYVVHIDHGVGRFSGLNQVSAGGVEREYLVLEYAAGDRLYVPVEQIGRVSPYVGTSDRPPVLNRLGTQEWQRTKKAVEQSVADIAQELLSLYANREVTTGFAFSPDTLWQQELEASFPYLETPDQAEVVFAIKEDMEKARPMDRLICGDVGYGKTEVALRAAFKAVMDNKQVAILVPTTILAQQHFATFIQRLQPFPLKIGVLSRFCSPEKERETIVGLANGTVDICIGTHRLLQKDVAFKDLGLVIIDEEQRFGVAQKEKLKQMRREVDVLTLTATPIPRTLHMSLTGIRDMSIIETSPEERLSIKTYVGAYDDVLVREAILRELERNGQVFFVHNRVQSIPFVASRLQSLVPEAEISIAHGQMHEDELGKVMADFMAGRCDILVATTIIQLGLDMPNVNTLIVDQADKFGLTQLYQLRGRIGRGINQAYAYFLFDKGKQLTLQAHKRLRTIFEITELGAGFGIAMKDLEIRGAGNLLGAEQSGHVAAVGFDLYSQMLAEAVEKLKLGQEGEGKRNVCVDKTKQVPSVALPLSAYIPEEYVSKLSTRLNLYRKLVNIGRIEEIRNMAQELRDRFGALPQQVEGLLYIIEIKIRAAKAGVGSIYTQGKQVVLSPVAERMSLSASCLRKYEYAIKIGASQLRLDTKRLGNKWQEVLQELLGG
ncbi:MAG: transcription-repair coupling factor [Dehalococcoidia bacterium]|nr:transcription-repair coupling factor [Dehalococcoidia bacterium]